MSETVGETSGNCADIYNESLEKNEISKVALEKKLVDTLSEIRNSDWYTNIKNSIQSTDGRPYISDLHLSEEEEMMDSLSDYDLSVETKKQLGEVELILNNRPDLGSKYPPSIDSLITIFKHYQEVSHINKTASNLLTELSTCIDNNITLKETK